MTLQKITCLVAGISLLTACATTSSVVHDSTPTPSAMSAKDALASAIKSQLYQSFSYQTDFYVSNHARRDELARTAKTVMDNTPTKNNCIKTHDDAYVALLKKAHAEHGGRKGLEKYLDKNYVQEKKAIMSDYQACMKTVFSHQNSYNPFSFDAFYQENYAPDMIEEAFLAASSAHMAVESATSAMSEKNPDDDMLNAKKAKLLDAYLLQPSHISVVGSYHPLKGHITALPNLQYNAKNLHLSINQPIHIDIKAGGIYLWADNFALANSQFLDKSLGDKWQNKWLFLPLNDGSLPEDFIKDLTKAYLNAKKESFLVTPNDSFHWVSADSLNDVPFLVDNLPQATFTTMQNTPRIIKNEVSAKDSAYRDYVFADVLYNAIIKKYPDLALEQVLGYNPQTMERNIIDGESVITVRNADETQEDSELKEPKMNARFFAIMFLSGLNQKVQDYYLSLERQAQDNNEMNTPNLVYYGIDGGKLSWISQRHHLNRLDSHLQKQDGKFTKTLSDMPMVVDVFTKIHQDANHVQVFSRLPSHLQIPNVSNSVNLLDYKDEFLKNLQSSDDKYLQTLMGLVFGGDIGELDEVGPENIELSEP